MAAEEGLYVIARPGPYVNAEISMGGLPAYLTNRAAGLRTTDPENLADAKAWLTAVCGIIARHQITDGGGSVLLYQVENELISETAARSEYLRTLADHVRAQGITGREGWHLPGHDDTAWDWVDDLVADAPGISWYRATFDLDTADDVDTTWRLAVRSTRFEDDRTDPCQIVLYVNGWNVGVYIGDMGPQAEFTIPPGFLDHHGTNTLALWVAAKEAGAGPQTVELVKVFDRTGSLGGGRPDRVIPRPMGETSAAGRRTVAGVRDRRGVGMSTMPAGSEAAQRACSS